MRTLAALVLLAAVPLIAQELPFISDRQLQSIANELSGESAQRNLEGISRQHRMRGSRQFRAAADLIATELKRYGYSDARVEQFPADGKIFYGTQRSRPAWNAELAELWEVQKDGRRVRLADWNAEPLTLAQDSTSGEATALLLDIGAGTSESDYANKEVRGRYVLTSSQPSAVVPLAVKRFGAAGIVSYAQNQPTAWWGEDENLIRWGHLDTFSDTPAFAFMVTLKQARDFQRRLAAGEEVMLHGIVRAAQSSGGYDIPMATITGSDPSLASQEIIYSCHLDHPRPGANDNASGCATILEVARTIRKLIEEKRIAPPRRTMRFVWPPEIEGTLALLNARPQIRASARAAIHLDMVGGGQETKAMFHVTRGPASLPSFIYDIAAAVGSFANEETSRYARTGRARFPLVANGGGKEALLAQMVPFTIGSDHQVYADSSFSIPAVYLNDWPDRYIHTNADRAANIDPSKLERAAFIAAVTGYTLANLTAVDAAGIESVIEAAALERAAAVFRQARGLAPAERDNVYRFARSYEAEVKASLRRWTGASEKRGDAASVVDSLLRPTAAPQPRGSVYRRNPQLLGPMSAFGYDYFHDKYGDGASKIALFSFQAARGSGDEYAYEALNLVNGRRTTSEIRDVLSAIYGPIPRELVDEYLGALERIKVVLK